MSIQQLIKYLNSLCKLNCDCALPVLDETIFSLEPTAVGAINYEI